MKTASKMSFPDIFMLFYKFELCIFWIWIRFLFYELFVLTAYFSNAGEAVKPL